MSRVNMPLPITCPHSVPQSPGKQDHRGRSMPEDGAPISRPRNVTQGWHLCKKVVTCAVSVGATLHTVRLEISP